MTSISTCLWFAPDVAPNAVELYTSLIPHSRVSSTLTLRNEQQPSGQVQLWTLDLAGATVRVMGSPGGEKFTTAHSIWITVDDQEQLDQVWDGFLTRGGTEMACGWIVDPFGVKWQVIPTVWYELTQTGDAERAQRVAVALWQMTRIDVAALERAARQV